MLVKVKVLDIFGFASVAVATETERVLEIRGLPNDVQTAQVMIHQVLCAQPRTETRRIEVDFRAVGKLVGRGGENIRRMQASSRCKIDIQRGSDESKSGVRS